MSEGKNKVVCPTCKGTGKVEGVCETSGEWQGTNTDDGQVCTPTETCPTCNGLGYVFE